MPVDDLKVQVANIEKLLCSLQESYEDYVSKCPLSLQIAFKEVLERGETARKLNMIITLLVVSALLGAFMIFSMFRLAT